MVLMISGSRLVFCASSVVRFFMSSELIWMKESVVISVKEYIVFLHKWSHSDILYITTLYLVSSMNIPQDITYDILILVADSYSLTPDEKIRITHAISEWYISDDKVKMLSEILLKEQRTIGNEQANYMKKVIWKITIFEEEKYTHTSMKYLKEKLAGIYIKHQKNISEFDRYTDRIESEVLLKSI